MKFTLKHKPTTTDTIFRGALIFRIEDNVNQGNCQTNTSSGSVTHIGSLTYDRDSTRSPEMKLQLKSGTFCGKSAEGTNGLDSNGLSDPTSSNITYAPTNSCLYDSNNDPTNPNGYQIIKY